MIEEKPKYLNPRWVDKKNRRLWCEILVGDKYHQCNINVGNPDEGLVNKDFDAIMEMVVLKKPLRDLPKMNVLSRQDVQRAIDQIQTALDYYRSMDTRPVLIEVGNTEIRNVKSMKNNKIKGINKKIVSKPSIV